MMVTQVDLLPTLIEAAMMHAHTSVGEGVSRAFPSFTQPV
jgi:hypothetical protein